MNSFSMVFAYLRNRPMPTLLNVLLLALGVATIVLLMLFASQAEDKLKRDARGIDLVVGAKGSPMQLILSSNYHLDVPTGNIPLALGDSYRGFRIVGTTPVFMELHDAKLAQGATWKAPMEAVLGAQAARETGLKPGAAFAGSHGLNSGGQGHADAPYRVAGVLASTGGVIDRLLLTSVESVWSVHEAHGKQNAPQNALASMIAVMPQPARQHANEEQADASHAGDGKEATAFQVQYATPLAAAIMPRRVNSQSASQAASPAYESARLLSLLGDGIDTLRAFALVLILGAALGVFIALSNALEERRHDLALLRVLGAPQGRLFRLLIVEGVTLTAAGVILGLLLGHLGAEIIGHWLADARHVKLSGAVWVKEELWLVPAALGLGVMAALIPALRVYLGDIAPTLSQR